MAYVYMYSCSMYDICIHIHLFVVFCFPYVILIDYFLFQVVYYSSFVSKVRTSLLVQVRNDVIAAC